MNVSCVEAAGCLDLTFDEAAALRGGEVGGWDTLLKIGVYTVKYTLEHIGEFVQGINDGAAGCGCG